ncbi:MAG: lysophospholipid acyltransferase family protein [Aquificae bacterium]|nr:lysophospholipid acyltransferase family protein [Aquificota bacterium]
MPFDWRVLRPHLRRLLQRSDPVLYGVLRLWRSSLRFDDRFWRAIEPDRPALIALYHGELLPLTLYGAFRPKLATVVSRHGDGEIIARVLKRLGYRTLRGSTDEGKNRGGAAALKELIRAVREGYHVAITVDGPRGPCCRVKRGILYAAALLKRPIYPVRIEVSGFRLPSWDRFLVPLPFSEVKIRLGEPLRVEDAENLDPYGRELERRLRRLGPPP